jgi:16S rRNA (cytosine1402-N4)-methyltransferase
VSELFEHVPVLLAEAVEWLTPALSDGGPLVDCTVGGGGHSEAFLEALPGLMVVAIDRDSEALEAAAGRLDRFGKAVRFVKSNFADIGDVLRELGHEQVGAFLYDLGVSSPQLGRAGRGFGYRPGFALDMRMDRSSAPKAADIVNNYSETELSDIIFRYGEERFARRIAHAIVQRRAKQSFTDAGDLAEVVKAAIPAATRRTGPHPARRTFQAIRIETNQELESLESALDSSIDLLRPGGRIAVMSYHSLEDRIVKNSFREASQGCICPRDVPVCVCGHRASLKVLTSKAIRPGEHELEVNPRADSARMRVAMKLEAA